MTTAVLRYTTVPIVLSSNGLSPSDLPQHGSVRFSFNNQTTAQDLFQNIDNLIAQKLPGRKRDSPSELFYYPPAAFGSSQASMPPVPISLGATLAQVPEIAERIAASLASETTGVPSLSEQPIILAARKHSRAVPRSPKVKKATQVAEAAAVDVGAVAAVRAEQLVAENMADMKGTTATEAVATAVEIPANARVHWTERLKVYPNAVALTEALTNEEEALTAYLRVLEKKNAELKAQRNAHNQRIAAVNSELQKQKAFINANADVIRRKEELNADVERLRIEIEVHDRRRDELVSQMAASQRAGSPRSANTLASPDRYDHEGKGIGASPSPLTHATDRQILAADTTVTSTAHNTVQQDPQYSDALARVQTQMGFLNIGAPQKHSSYNVNQPDFATESVNGGEESSYGLHGVQNPIYEPSTTNTNGAPPQRGGVFGRQLQHQYQRDEKNHHPSATSSLWGRSIGNHVPNTTMNYSSPAVEAAVSASEIAAAFEEVTEMDESAWLSTDLQQEVAEVLSKPPNPLPMPRYLHARDRYSSLSPERSRYVLDSQAKLPATFASDLNGYLSRAATSATALDQRPSAISTMLTTADAANYTTSEQNTKTSAGTPLNATPTETLALSAQWRQRSEVEYQSPPPRIASTTHHYPATSFYPTQQPLHSMTRMINQQPQSYTPDFNHSPSGGNNQSLHRSGFQSAIDNRRSMAMAAQQPFYPPPSSVTYMDAMEKIYRHQQQEAARAEIATYATPSTVAPNTYRDGISMNTAVDPSSGGMIGMGGSRSIFGRTSSRLEGASSNTTAAPPQFY